MPSRSTNRVLASGDSGILQIEHPTTQVRLGGECFRSYRAHRRSTRADLAEELGHAERACHARTVLAGGHRLVVTRSPSMPRNSTNEVIRFQRKSPYSNGRNRSGGSLGSGAMVASARAS